MSMGWVLEELGHRVYYLNQIQEDTLEQAIRTFAPDIFFDMGWDAHFKPVRIPLLGAILKKYRLYHVYFAEEDWLHFERWSKQYITQVTPHFVLTRSRRCLPEYCGMGIRAAYLDVGCNPSFHRTVAPHSTYACDVSVAANAQLRWDIFRRQSIANLVLALSETPHNFQIWGEAGTKSNRITGLPILARRFGKVCFHTRKRLFSTTLHPST
ncbi:hypothetical protein GCM10025857_08720 [Alicyclobacillus contaminans]|nr:hypothetical protein GCM10025857_08720 [Alicyclobacillus contaminans]